MPAKPKRQLRSPERKLRPVPERQNEKMSKRFRTKNMRFYYDLQGKIFGVQTLQSGKEKRWTVIVTREFAENNLEVYAATTLHVIPSMFTEKNALLIYGLEKIEGSLKENRGQMLFRAVLNEAMRIAKREKVNIEIETKYLELANYYQSFGFRIKEKTRKDIMSGQLRKMYNGVLELKKGGKA